MSGADGWRGRIVRRDGVSGIERGAQRDLGMFGKDSCSIEERHDKYNLRRNSRGGVPGEG